MVLITLLIFKQLIIASVDLSVIEFLARFKLFMLELFSKAFKTIIAPSSERDDLVSFNSLTLEFLCVIFSATILAASSPITKSIN
jgi:hypothetical protein